MESIDAVMIIECEDNPSTESYLEAWSTLIKSGQVWSLQGFYGRGATQLIDSWIISSDGIIDWDEVNDRL